MAIIDIDELKEQLRIDHADDDDLLGRKIEAAQSHVERLLGFKMDAETYPAEGEVTFPDTVPAPLRECVCQLAAHWYERREAVTFGDAGQVLPIGVDDVVREFRNYSWAV
jgi:uncharacterized phage protein (predicted DNA packaging)